MSTGLRYHLCMRRWLPLALILAGLVGIPASEAQINGVRASVTSLGGSPVFPPGPRASVTSLGPMGFTPHSGSRNCCFSFGVNHHHPNVFGNGRRGFGGYGFALPIYSVPYYYPGYADIVDPVDDSMEQGYAGTVDRRQERDRASDHQYDERLSRLEKQMDDMEDNSPPKAQPPQQAAQTPLTEQPDTVLVFRDGHSVDVKNYAIVGDTLYDLSSGSRHKIALADLDLGATQKQNDDRGSDFRLPTRPLGN